MLLKRFYQLCTVVCLGLSFCLCLAAQDGPMIVPKAQPQSDQQAQQQDQQGQQPANSNDQDLQTFKAQVNVVNLFFNVKDKHGLLIPNLTKDDFQVVEDGKPQTIKYFSTESQQPLTLGIMIDTSASQTRVLDIEQESCAQFLHEVLRAKDLAFVINFDVDVDLDQDFTSNIRDLTSRVEQDADQRRSRRWASRTWRRPCAHHASRHATVRRNLPGRG